MYPQVIRALDKNVTMKKYNFYTFKKIYQKNEFDMVDNSTLTLNDGKGFIFHQKHSFLI